MGLVGAYGISFGNLKTYQWITAMFVNFFWNIFIESVIKVSYSNTLNDSTLSKPRLES